jgi:hypothetical protein
MPALHIGNEPSESEILALRAHMTNNVCLPVHTQELHFPSHVHRKHPRPRRQTILVFSNLFCELGSNPSATFPAPDNDANFRRRLGSIMLIYTCKIDYRSTSLQRTHMKVDKNFHVWFRIEKIYVTFKSLDLNNDNLIFLQFSTKF